MDINRWSRLTLFEQMAHIGSEIERARICDEKNDPSMRQRAIERAFDLIDVSLKDMRWQKRLKEFCLLREVLADHYARTHEYQVSLEDLEDHCNQFAFALRKDY